MNLNSLVIVASPSRARLFRTARTSITEQVELIEVDSLDSSDAHSEGAGAESQGSPRAPEPGTRRAPDAAGHHAGLRTFARQIAALAAGFAQYHFCNPVIVTAERGVCSLIQTELARELPAVHVRAISADIVDQPTAAILRDLEERGAFEPVHYSCPI